MKYCGNFALLLLPFSDLLKGTFHTQLKQFFQGQLIKEKKKKTDFPVSFVFILSFIQVEFFTVAQRPGVK